MNKSPFDRSALAAVALAAAMALSQGCGLVLEAGIWLAVTSIGEEDDGPAASSLPSASQGQLMSAQPLRGSVEFRFRLSDPEGDTADAAVDYSTDDGQTWLPCTDSGVPPSEGRIDLATSPAGILHTFVWDLQADLPSASNWNAHVILRISPVEQASGAAGTAFSSPQFLVNVNTDPVATGFTPETGLHESATVQYILIDREGDSADVEPAFSTDGGAAWNPATRLGSMGDGLSGLSASAGGDLHSFVWDSALDLPGDAGQNADVLFRIRPSDPSLGWADGNVWTIAFAANRNESPEVGFYTPSGYFPSTVDLNLTLSDAESDAADLDVEFAVSTGPGTWSSWSDASDAGGASEGKAGLSAPAAGVFHLFVWNSSSDVVQSSAEVRIRISASDSAFPSVAGPWVESEPFFVNNSGNLPWAVVPTPSGTKFFDVPVPYTLFDNDSNPANVSAGYSVSGGTWQPATLSAAATEGLTNLATSPAGTAHVFLWDSIADLGGTRSAEVKFRILPSEGATPGVPGASGLFTLDNRRIQTIAGGASGPFNKPFCVAVSSGGLVFLADTNNHRIKVFNASSQSVNVAGITVQAGSTATIAGTGIAGFNSDNLPGTQTQFNTPSSIALTAASPPDVIVADSLNNRVRRIDGVSGYVTTIAGTGSAGTANDGKLATTAELNQPRGVALDSQGRVAIADTLNDCLRLLNAGSAPVTVCQATVNPGCLGTVAGSLDTPGIVDNCAASAARFKEPWGAAVDSAGNWFVADTGNHWIRAVNAQAAPITVGNVSIPAGFARKVAGGNQPLAGFAGDGVSAVQANARLSSPRSITLDASGNFFFADTANHTVRAVNAKSAGGLTVGAVSIAFGDIDTVAGTGTSAGFGGDGGPATNPAALLNTPGGVFLRSGVLYVADTFNSHVRAVNTDSNSSNFVAIGSVNVYGTEIETIEGSGGGSVTLASPSGIALSGQELFIADPQLNRILKHDLSTGTLSSAYGSGLPVFGGDGLAATAPQVAFQAPEGVAFDSFGNVYVCDTQNQRVRVVNRQTVAVTVGSVTIPAGCIDTIATLVVLTGPVSMSIASSATQANPILYAYIADSADHRIARLDGTTGSVTTIAGTLGSNGFSGDGGSAASALLDSPRSVAVDSAGNLYICDSVNARVRAVNMQASAVSICGVLIQPGCIDTIAGTGTQAYNGDGIFAIFANLGTPAGVVVESSGRVFVTDLTGRRIRGIDGSTGIISTVCGTGAAGYGGDLVPSENSPVNAPAGVALDAFGMIFFSDSGNLIVRRFFP